MALSAGLILAVDAYKLATGTKEAIDLLGSFRGVVNRGVAALHEKRAAQLLQQVAVELGSNDVAKGAILLREIVQDERSAETIFRAYRAVMDSVCEEASVPMAAVATEYLHRAKAPDRRFRRVGAFLGDATIEDMRAAVQVCDLIMKVARFTGERSVDIRVAANDRDGIVFVHVEAGSKTPELFESARANVAGSGALRDVLLMLVRHGFALLVTDGPAREMDDLPGRPWVNERAIVPWGEYLDSVELLHLALLTGTRPKSEETHERS